MNHRWFMTAPGSRWDGRDGELVPVGTVHAKEMGTIQTACGLGCGGWPKFWDRPFAPVTRGADDVCPACRVAISDATG